MFVDEMFPASYGSPAAVFPVLPETGSSLFEVPIPSAFLIVSILCGCLILINCCMRGDGYYTKGCGY